MRSDWNLTWLGGVAAIVLIFAASIAAASPATMLEEGIYAEQTKGDLNEAIQIYRRIIADDAANRRHVSEALYRLGSCRLKQGDPQAATGAYGRLAGLYPERSDLIEQAESQMAAFYREHPDAAAPAHPVTLPDPASLMPADTLAYVEIGSPGMQVETLLKLLAGTPLANPLAVVRSAPGAGGHSPQGVAAALLNPSMIKEFKKIRGLAVGFQGIAVNRQPPIVCVMYPGESDALRGLIVAGLMMQGQQDEPIEGMQVVRLSDQCAAAMDDNVILIAAPTDRLTWCIRQYKGLATEPTLATSNESFAPLDRQNRLQDALTFWADGAATVEALRPTLGSSSKFMIADAIIDLNDLRSVGARMVINQTDPFVEVSVDMAEGHTNLAYGLIRTPNLTAAGFEAVPADAVAVASFALSANDQAAQAAAIEKALSLTGLDLGREIFANIEQVTLFALPADYAKGRSEWVPECGPIPLTLGLTLTSRNPAQTRLLLETALSKVDAVAAVAGKTAQVLVDEQSLPAGVNGHVVYRRKPAKGPARMSKVYLGQAGRSTILSLNPQIVAAAMKATTTGDNAVTGGPLSANLGQLPAETSKLVLVHASGAVGLAQLLVGVEGITDEQVAETADRLAEGLGTMTVQAATREAPNRFIFRAGVNDLTPLGDLLPLFMEYNAKYSQAQRGLDRKIAKRQYGDWMGVWRGTIDNWEGEAVDAAAEVRIHYCNRYIARVIVSGGGVSGRKVASPQSKIVDNVKRPAMQISLQDHRRARLDLIDGEIHLIVPSAGGKEGFTVRLQKVADESAAAATVETR